MKLRFRFRPHLRRRARGQPVRGTVSNVIVVKAPAPCFREALFVLRDEYLTDANRDRETLLHEAREAAASFTGPAVPPPPRRFLWLLPAAALLLAGAAKLLGFV